MSVTKISMHVQLQTSIKQFIQKRNRINVIYVAKTSVTGFILWFIGEFMLERNHINVIYVAKPLVKMHTLQFTREFILEFSSVPLLSRVQLFATP